MKFVIVFDLFKGSLMVKEVVIVMVIGIKWVYFDVE